MDQEEAAVSGKNFFVHLAGKTNGAHRAIVEKLEGCGHTEVDSVEQSDYTLVFCPVASRVGTDISEALDNIPGNKPTTLVVMHHTFNPDHVVAESRRRVTNPNVHLTVDCVFYEGKLLECNRNEIAWFEVQKFFGVSASQLSTLRGFNNYVSNGLKNHLKLVAFVVCCAVVVLVIIVIVIAVQKK